MPSKNRFCVPEWRVARSFEPSEIERHMARLASCPVSVPSEWPVTDPRFKYYYSQAVIAVEAPGEPVAAGAFERARTLLERYEFSDPRIVTAYFDPRRQLLGRTMLLEIKAMGIHYLCGVLVRAVRDESTSRESLFGYRYDTLEGHLEQGSEWFLLSKQHSSGAVRFRIQAVWREGQFPNLWSRLGFRLVAPSYQRAWHRLAYLRLRKMLGAGDLPPLPPFGQLLKQARPLAVPPLFSVSRRAPPHARGPGSSAGSPSPRRHR